MVTSHEHDNAESYFVMVCQRLLYRHYLHVKRSHIDFMGKVSQESLDCPHQHIMIPLDRYLSSVTRGFMCIIVLLSEISMYFKALFLPVNLLLLPWHMYEYKCLFPYLSAVHDSTAYSIYASCMQLSLSNLRLRVDMNH